MASKFLIAQPPCPGFAMFRGPEWSISTEGRTMSYVRRVLQPDETVRFKSTIHWIVYFPAFVFFLIGCAGLALLYANGPNFVAMIVIAGGFGLALLSFLSSWIRRFSTEIAVTDRRIITKRGLFARHTLEMNMDKVESVDVDQSILGRIFDYGTIVIHGTGADVEPLVGIDSPIDFRNAVVAR
jgi:uncharacterized membrane protein YdbT with pleckstrin-like domain